MLHFATPNFFLVAAPITAIILYRMVTKTL
jgi:hypothetical protein